MLLRPVPVVLTMWDEINGRSAAAVEESVAQVIEAQVNGVDKMIYMKSTSGGDGSYTLNITFHVGSDPDLNTVNVTNRVNQALAQLPPEVQRNGLTTRKQSPQPRSV